MFIEIVDDVFITMDELESMINNSDTSVPNEVIDKDEDDSQSDAGASGSSIETGTGDTTDQDTSGATTNASVSVLNVVAFNWALFVIAAATTACWLG